jgi:hypothetical protein
MDDQKAKGIKFLELINKRDLLEGATIQRMLFNLATAHFAVNRNYEELVNGINYIEGNLPIWDVKNRKIFDSILREISRLLHNYLSSTFTLIQHNVKLCHDLKNGELDTQYNTKVKELDENPTVSFIKNLRTFAQHVGLPILSARFSINNITSTGPQAEQSVQLDKETLLRWNNWRAASRAFIESHGDIDLKTVLKDYQGLITSFYNWFYAAVTSLFSQQLKELDAINRQIVECNPFQDNNREGRQKEHKETWYCIWGCGFKTTDIFQVANHELFCSKKKQFSVHK